MSDQPPARSKLGLDLSLTLGNVLQIVLMVTALTIWLLSYVGRTDDTATRLAEFKAAELAQQALLAADMQKRFDDIQRTQASMQGRLDGMWRTSDYTDRDTHLARLDNVFDALRDRMVKAEYDIKDTAKAVQSLVAVPPRK